MGDKVKVLCKAEDEERGWDECWSDNMDSYINKVVNITSIDEYGVRVDCKYWFPAFVLEKVEEKKEVLVAFDYEKAKSKPTLVRFEHSGKPHNIIFTPNPFTVASFSRLQKIFTKKVAKLFGVMNYTHIFV